MGDADEAWDDWYAGFPELAPMNAEIGFKAGYVTGYRAALTEAADALGFWWDEGSGTAKGIPYERSEAALIEWLRARAVAAKDGSEG